MPKKSKIAQEKKLKKKAKYSTKVYNRCSICGRQGSYIRRFGVCRICFRELANKGEIPGIRKSSW